MIHSWEGYLAWCAWWVGLGILSSVGLGTGLHTFLLYLGPHIAAVTVKLPPFYRNNCEYWINQCQAQFAVRNITAQLTKFYYCVSVIDEGTALHIEDIVSNPGETPYDDLCDRLREAFS